MATSHQSKAVPPAAAPAVQPFKPGSNWAMLKQKLGHTKRKLEEFSEDTPKKRHQPALAPSTAKVTSPQGPRTLLEIVKEASPDMKGNKRLPIDPMRILAMDCEMVGVGASGRRSALARCSIVDYDGEVVYDRFVLPQERVTDFRTRVSGVRPKDLKDAVDFKTCAKDVAGLLKDKILVGHALHNDMKVLFFDHPKHLTRDTAKYKALMVPRRTGLKLKPQALRTLAERELGVKIQTGEHNSVDDARAALGVYKKHMLVWEHSLRSGGHQKHGLPRAKPHTISREALHKAAGGNSY